MSTPTIKTAVMPHLRQSIFSAPLAVLPHCAEALAEIHERVFAETAIWYGMKFDVQGIERIGRLAMIPVQGPFVCMDSPDPRIFDATSANLVGDMMEEAAASDAETICLCFNTPGGQAEGIAELAAEIFAARAMSGKYLIAHVEGCCASAGYWLASQCETIFASEMSQIGSIGVIGKISSTDRLEKNMGIDSVIVSSSELKATGYGPLTPNQTSYLQRMMLGLDDVFREAVLRGRPQLDLSTVGTGETWLARDTPRGGPGAVSLGLCDAIATRAEIVAEFS